MESPPYVAVAAYVPAEVAVKAQLQMVWFDPVPVSGPVWVVQLLAGPVRPHVMVPVGAVAPVTPVTVAVKVIVSPKFGLEGVTPTEMVGLDVPTVIETGDVAGSAAYVPSPL